ncbi:MAG TPA: hypothetical protein VMT89_06005 [Candidatus Acidoferrales bacterium]|nr:hypothetical protein [Candidatus Acidoferrales bacterium]
MEVYDPGVGVGVGGGGHIFTHPLRDFLQSFTAALFISRQLSRQMNAPI